MKISDSVQCLARGRNRQYSAHSFYICFLIFKWCLQLCVIRRATRRRQTRSGGLTMGRVLLQEYNPYHLCIILSLTADWSLPIYEQLPVLFLLDANRSPAGFICVVVPFLHIHHPRFCQESLALYTNTKESSRGILCYDDDFGTWPCLLLAPMTSLPRTIYWMNLRFVANCFRLRSCFIFAVTCSSLTGIVRTPWFSWISCTVTPYGQ